MRLELMLLPDAMNRVLADLLQLSQRACTPMRRTLWFALKRSVNNASGHCRPVAWFTSSARCDLPNAADTLLAHATAPQRDGEPVNVELRGDLLVAASLSCSEDYSRSEHDLLRG